MPLNAVACEPQKASIEPAGSSHAKSTHTACDSICICTSQWACCAPRAPQAAAARPSVVFNYPPVHQRLHPAPANAVIRPGAPRGAWGLAGELSWPGCARPAAGVRGWSPRAVSSRLCRAARPPCPSTGLRVRPSVRRLDSSLFGLSQTLLIAARGLGGGRGGYCGGAAVQSTAVVGRSGAGGKGPNPDSLPLPPTQCCAACSQPTERGACLCRLANPDWCHWMMTTLCVANLLQPPGRPHRRHRRRPCGPTPQPPPPPPGSIWHDSAAAVVTGSRHDWAVRCKLPSRPSRLSYPGGRRWLAVGQASVPVQATRSRRALQVTSHTRVAGIPQRRAPPVDTDPVQHNQGRSLQPRPRPAPHSGHHRRHVSPSSSTAHFEDSGLLTRSQ
jgi:hypothetical protein